MNFESLECRRVMSVSVVLTADGILQITGTEGPDDVTVINPAAWGLASDQDIQVYVSEPPGTAGILVGEFSGVKGIHARMYGGDDGLDCGWVDSPAADGTPLPVKGISVFADMGVGDDRLWGGGSRDVLIGGDGDDAITDYTHDNSDDVMIGGNGNDYLQAYGDANILIGGNGDDQLAGSTEDLLVGGAGWDAIEQ